MWTLFDFYRSKEWENFRQIVISERTDADGFIRDEITGEPIVKRYDIILHHKIFLTEENVNDRSISLNPDNIQIVSHATHNRIHERLGYKRKEVFFVYGPPLSGKTSFVSSVALPGDLIINMDSIWECISGQPRYTKPGKLKSIAFMVRDALLDAVRVRAGKWNNAYIITGGALISDRETMLKTYGARPVFISAPQAECLERLEQDTQRDHDEWREYIDEWFRRYSPGLKK